MTIGFIVECAPLGPDEVLVREVMRRFRPDDEPKTVVLARNNKGILLANAVKDTASLIKQGCAKVFILWDWHPIEVNWGETRNEWRPGMCRKEAAKLRKDLVAAGVNIKKVVLVCVTQEVEAWALADKTAIKAQVTDRLKTHQPRHIHVPKTPWPEEEPDPERRLENIFKKNEVALVKHQDVPAIFRYAATSCFKKWDTCPAFTRFVDRLLGTEDGFDDAVADCERRAAARQPHVERGRQR